MGWLKYLLYEFGYWTPIKTKDIITVLIYKEINPYIRDHSIEVSTLDVTHSTLVMEKLLSKNPDKDYLITSSLNLIPLNKTYLSDWFSINKRAIEIDYFTEWLKLALEIVKLYKYCLKQNKDSKAYRNGVKLKIIMDEIESIINGIL